MNAKDHNILSAIRRRAGDTPEKTMLMVDGERVSYAGFLDEVDRMAATLAACGVCPDDRVAVAMPNCINWYIVFWAAVECGARPVPIDPQTGEWELRHLFGVMDFRVCCIVGSYRANPLKHNFAVAIDGCSVPPRVIVMDSEREEHPFASMADLRNNLQLNTAARPSRPEPGEILMYACTSGTTGNPKILTVEHAGFCQSQRDMATYLELNPGDTMLLGMPLYHQGGFGMGVQVLLAGGTVIYQSRFDPEQFLQTIADYNVTAIQLTPTLAKILLTVPGFKHPEVDNLKLCYFAGELLPDDVALRFYRDLDIRVVNIIGSSETATMVVWDSRYDAGCSVNDFRPLSFTEVILVDGQGNETEPGGTGILLVRTDAVIREYYKNPALSKETILMRNGRRWFNTGDCGCRLPDDRIRLMGRKKRIIKRGSNLVYPEEVEAFLLTHPLLVAVAVTSEPHEIFGEMIVASVQTAGGTGLSKGELVQFCKGKLSAFKIPDRFIFVDELPKDIGKIQFKYLKPEADMKGPGHEQPESC